MSNDVYDDEYDAVKLFMHTASYNASMEVPMSKEVYTGEYDATKLNNGNPDEIMVVVSSLYV